MEDAASSTIHSNKDSHTDHRSTATDSLLTVQSKAGALIKTGEFTEAVNLYTFWLENNLRSRSRTTAMKKQHCENIALAHNNRGHAKYLNVDFDGALIDYNEGLKYDPTLPVLYYNRGTIMYRMGYFDKAVVDLLVAVRLEPDCTEFHVALQKAMNQIRTSKPEN